jgi:hypothetical protein
VGAAAVRRDFGLELPYGRPQDERLRVAEVLDGGIDLGFEGAVLGLEIEQGDLHGRDSL